MVYESIKLAEDLSKEKKESLKMISFKFLGPVFLTAASGKEEWKMSFAESSLILFQEMSSNINVLQSFFCLNSSIETEDGNTNLFALIGSPHTEDVSRIYEKLKKYIHPSIIQGRMVNQGIQAMDFRFDRFVTEELNRGKKLVDFSLGSSRKMYWEEQQKYYCMGVIERKEVDGKKITKLFTFDKENELLKSLSPYIPSFYVMAVIPNYYDNIVNETLELFEKKGIFSNIRQVHMNYENKKVLYFEEFLVEKGSKTSYGTILIPANGIGTINGSNRTSFYKKSLRSILDLNKNLKDVLKKINPDFRLEGWGANSDEELNDIRRFLDN